MEVFTKICLAAAGDVSGAVSSFGVNLLFAKMFTGFPSVTFFINITGSFLIGLLLTILSEEYDVGENIRLTLIVGFLAAYTTLSTFEFETFTLINNRNLTTAFIYVILSLALGLIGVISGVWVGKRFQ